MCSGVTAPSASLFPVTASFASMPVVTPPLAIDTSSALTLIPAPAPTWSVTSPDAPPPVSPSPAVTPVIPGGAFAASSDSAYVISKVVGSWEPLAIMEP